MSKVKFPIAAKLILIVSIIVALSLGFIISFVSHIVRQDLLISTEANNEAVNLCSAMEAENLILNIRSHSRILLNTNITKESIEYFFVENPQIGVVYFDRPGKVAQYFENDTFFLSRGLQMAAVKSFFEQQNISLSRAKRGETLIINAAPYFSRPFLVLFFPIRDATAAVMFSSEALNKSFGLGENRSFMINSDGDIIAASDFSIIQSAMNLAGETFIFDIVKDEQRTGQKLIDADLSFIKSDSVKTKDESFFWDKLDMAWMATYKLLSEYIPAQDTGRYFTAYSKLNIAGIIVITSIEYESVFESIAAAERRGIILSIAVLIISVILTLVLSKRITARLRLLAASVKKIENGVFETAPVSKRKDEAGLLTENFNKACKALNVFGQYSHKEIALKAMSGEIKRGGFPKHATIFFSGIHDFDYKCEQFPMAFGSGAYEKIILWLNDYFSKMTDCVEKSDGVVDKFIEDQIMAHWGAVSTAGNPRTDAFNCVKAALLMRKELSLLNNEKDYYDPGNPVIKIGCGISTGMVTAGQIGSDKRIEYTVIGEAVSIASKLKDLAKSSDADIIISEDTWKLVGDKFVTKELSSIIVNKKTIRTFSVVNFLGL